MELEEFLFDLFMVHAPLFEEPQMDGRQFPAQGTVRTLAATRELDRVVYSGVHKFGVGELHPGAVMRSILVDTFGVNDPTKDLMLGVLDDSATLSLSRRRRGCHCELEFAVLDAA